MGFWTYRYNRYIGAASCLQGTRGCLAYPLEAWVGSNKRNDGIFLWLGNTEPIEHTGFCGMASRALRPFNFSGMDKGDSPLLPQKMAGNRALGHIFARGSVF